MALDNELSALQASVPSIVFSMGTSTGETSERHLTSVAFQIANHVPTSVAPLWRKRFARGERHKLQSLHVDGKIYP